MDEPPDASGTRPHTRGPGAGTPGVDDNEDEGFGKLAGSSHGEMPVVNGGGQTQGGG